MHALDFLKVLRFSYKKSTARASRSWKKIEVDLQASLIMRVWVH